MRRDHRPFFLKRLTDAINQQMADWRLLPQFDHNGVECRFMYPRHIEVSGNQISLGDHVHIMALPDSPVRLSNFQNLGKIHIGNYCIVNPGVRITSASEVQVGDSCMLAMNCYLSDADWHDLHHRIYAPGNTAPIILEDNVWIGDSALVCKGVTIGRNSVVGAWSVVTKDVPQNVVVAGNPARVVRELDDSHLTMRRDLFEGDVPYSDFEKDYFGSIMAGNTLFDWVRSVIKPGRED